MIHGDDMFAIGLRAELEWFGGEVKVRFDVQEHPLVGPGPGLGKEERIPRGAMHVVNHVPRHAIRFSDKLYTTDQHLPSAFRHEIALPEGTFPEAWLDLEEDPLSTAPG